MCIATKDECCHANHVLAAAARLVEAIITTSLSSALSCSSWLLLAVMGVSEEA